MVRSLMAFLIATSVVAPLSARAAGMVADKGFHSVVAKPAYAKQGPRVLFDRGHHNVGVANGAYEALFGLLRDDGYEVLFLDGPVTAKALAGTKIFAVLAPCGDGDLRSAKAANSAFTADEVGAIEAWVKKGNSLLVMADGPPVGKSVDSLMGRFGVKGSQGSTESKARMIKPLNDPSSLMFTAIEIELKHPIVKGRNQDEQILRVAGFGGESLAAPAGSSVILHFDPSAVDRGARLVSTQGRVAGLTLKHGSGRVAAFGDAEMFAALTDSSTSAKRGMNYPGTDNARFALNTFHWLSGLTEK